MELVRESDGITRIGPMESPNVTYMEEFRAVLPNPENRIDGGGGNFTVLGGGFSPNAEYRCVLSRANETGYPWLAEERMYVHAEFVAPDRLTCNPARLALLGGGQP